MGQIPTWPGLQARSVPTVQCNLCLVYRSYVNYGDERDELPSHQRRNDTMSPETKHKMKQQIDLRGVEFDPSPFQLVAKTSLYKVHTLFSLLGVTVACVPC